MGMFTWLSLALVSLYPFFTFDVYATSTHLMSNQTQDDFIDTCGIAYCGKGTCHPSTVFPFFTCICDSGWKKPDIGSTAVPCVLPNCTVDLNCGNNEFSPSTRPGDVAFDPCLLTVCGDGVCERQGADYRCRCNEGSANLLNDPKLLCFNKCTFGADCNGFDLGFGTPEPPPPPPPTSGTAPRTAGSAETLIGTRKILMVAITILVLIFQIWI